MSLRISSIDHGVTLTIPDFVSNRSAQEFIDEKRDWIAKHLGNLPSRISGSLSPYLPYQGDEFLAVSSDTKSVNICHESGQIFVPTDPKKRNVALIAFYRFAARNHLVKASDDYAARLGVSYSRINLRDTRSRWGSCSHSGTLMYSWRLVLAPPPVLDYVAAHEVAHLVHMHHGSEFWQLVKKICPEMETHRKWLRTHGVSLHKWDFNN